MPQNSFASCVTILLIVNILISACFCLNKEPESFESNELNSLSWVHVPQNLLDFSNICNAEKLGTISDWFDGWLAKFYIKMPITNTLVTSSIVIKEIESHLKAIADYTKNLGVFLDRFNEYSLLYMKIRMYGLIAKYNHDMELPYDLQSKLKRESNSNKFDRFSQTLRTSEKDATSIDKVSEVFYQDLQHVHANSFDTLKLHTRLASIVSTYSLEIKSINQDICGVLISIVELFANHPNFQSTWEKLQKTPELIGELSLFYSKFSYALNDFRGPVCGENLEIVTVRAAISVSLIGVNIDKQLKTTFFSSRLFQIMENDQKYAEIVKYDKLLLLGISANEDLSVVRKYSLRKIPFSVDFINSFPSIDVNLLSEGTKENAESIYKINLFLILYKFYVILRSQDFQMIKEGMTSTETFNVIFQWILSTNYFEQKILENDPVKDISSIQKDLKKVKRKNIDFPTVNDQNLVSRDETALYFPAIISLISTKNNIDVSKKEKEIQTSARKLNVLNQENNFSKNFVDEKITKIINENNKRDKLSGFSKEIMNMNYAKAIENCRQKLKEKTAKSIPVFTFNCVKEFYTEWVSIIERNLNKISNTDDSILYINTIDVTIRSLFIAEKRDLLEFTIIMYFQFLSKKSDKNLKSFEKKLAEMFLMKAMTLIASQIKVASVKSFTNFLVGASNYQTFGKYFKFIDPNESEFHGFNIFYIALFAQVNEAKNLELSNKIEESQRVIEYQNELTTIFEKRYPNLTSIMSADAQAHPRRFMKSIYKTLFFLKFLDFFDLFYIHFNDENEPIFPILKNDYISIHSVFINFYHFLYSLRNIIKIEIENPHLFVLEKMEECLVYSARSTSAAIDFGLEEFCVFSNRKYAEIYYFYKFYLVILNKLENISLKNFNEDELNTHTRMFFLFALNSPRFKRLLNEKCKEENSKWLDICISWVIFGEFYELIIDSTHSGLSFSFVKNFMMQKVLPNQNVKSASHVKFNILFAAEAVSLLVEGQGVNFGRFISLFNLNEHYLSTRPNNSEIALEDKSILELFQIQKTDTSNRLLMIQYLKKTYFKKARTSNEHAITLAITSILDEPTIQKNNLLLTAFTYAGHVIVNFVKLFLMYATKDQHFEKITDFLIDQRVFFELANLNRPIDDAFYKKVIAEIASKDQNYLVEKENLRMKKSAQKTSFPHDLDNYRKILFSMLQKRYESILRKTTIKLMKMTQADSHKNVQKEKNKFDIFKEFYKIGILEIKQNKPIETKNFEELNSNLALSSKHFGSVSVDNNLKFYAAESDENSNELQMSKSTSENTKSGSKSDESNAEKNSKVVSPNQQMDNPNMLTFTEKKILQDMSNKVKEIAGINSQEISVNENTPNIIEALIELGEDIESSPLFFESVHMGDDDNETRFNYDKGHQNSSDRLSDRVISTEINIDLEKRRILVN